MRCIEQRKLPFEYDEVEITSAGQMTQVIADMVVRGAGCIGHGVDLPAGRRGKQKLEGVHRVEQPLGDFRLAALRCHTASRLRRRAVVLRFLFRRQAHLAREGNGSLVHQRDRAALPAEASTGSAAQSAWLCLADRIHSRL